MKIGFKPKSYNDIIYFEVPNASKEDETFINTLIISAKTGGENDVDLIIQPNRKETQITAVKIEKAKIETPKAI